VYNAVVVVAGGHTQWASERASRRFLVTIKAINMLLQRGSQFPAVALLRRPQQLRPRLQDLH
jgi:hypothetical protein